MPTAGDARNGSEPLGFRIDLFSQRVYRRGEAVHVTKREVELLAFLAFCNRPVSKHELAEAFAPDSSSEDADRLIRVTVARIRKRFGNGIVITDRGSYALPPSVGHPLQEASAVLARCKTQPALSPQDARRIHGLAAEIEAYLAGGGLPYEWGAEFEHGLESLARELREIEQRLPVERVARSRLLALAVALIALAVVTTSAVQVRASWLSLQRRNDLALARMLASEGFARSAKSCSAMRERCIEAESYWLSVNVPKWSNITTPRVPSYYSVPYLRIANCGIAFSKVYTAVNSTAVLHRSREYGTLAQVESIFFDYRDYGGVQQRFTPWRTFPSVILESYVPFTRQHLHRPPDTYKYIFFLFDSPENAAAVMQHLKLLSLLCGSGPWAGTDWHDPVLPAH